MALQVLSCFYSYSPLMIQSDIGPGEMQQWVEPFDTLWGDLRLVDQVRSVVRHKEDGRPHHQSIVVLAH